MAKTTAPLLPSTQALLRQFGERLRLARLRRRLTAKQVAERAGMAPMTLRSLERGGSGVTMGAYLSVMQVLGIESDLGHLGKADPQGRELQDARLPGASKRTKTLVPITPAGPASTKRAKAVVDSVDQLHPLVEKSPQERRRQVLAPLPEEPLRKALHAQPQAQGLEAIDAKPSEPPHAALNQLQAPSKAIEKPLNPSDNEQNWWEQSGFSDSGTLAGLIRPLEPLPRKRR